MFEDYEDILEPSEADQIIEEARGKILDLLKDSVKADLAEANDAGYELARLKNEVRCAEAELERIKKDTEEAMKKAEECKNTIPQKYISTFVSRYTGGFAPGDTVYFAKRDTKTADCPVCNGAKSVSAVIMGDSQQIRCPKCGGRGYITRDIFCPAERTVDYVRLTLEFSTGRKHNAYPWRKACIYINGWDDPVGPDFIYHNREECEAKCKELEEKNA